MLGTRTIFLASCMAVFMTIGCGNETPPQNTPPYNPEVLEWPEETEPRNPVSSEMVVVNDISTYIEVVNGLENALLGEMHWFSYGKTSQQHSVAIKLLKTTGTEQPVSDLRIEDKDTSISASWRGNLENGVATLYFSEHYMKDGEVRHKTLNGTIDGDVGDTFKLGIERPEDLVAVSTYDNTPIKPSFRYGSPLAFYSFRIAQGNLIGTRAEDSPWHPVPSPTKDQVGLHAYLEAGGEDAVLKDFNLGIYPDYLSLGDLANVRVIDETGYTLCAFVTLPDFNVRCSGLAYAIAKGTKKKITVYYDINRVVGGSLQFSFWGTVATGKTSNRTLNSIETTTGHRFFVY